MTTTAGDLVSIRGLVESEFDNPLKKFSGVFAGYVTAPAQGYQGIRVDLNFKDLDNVVATSPYNFPTAVINIGQSNKNKSRWGYFANSIAKLLGPDEDLKDCVGRRMTMVFCDGQDGRPAPLPIWSKNADVAQFPDKMVPTVVWIALEIEGGATVGAAGQTETAAEWAAKNLVGKTKAQFNKWAFADERVRKDTTLQRSITDKSFIAGLVLAKQVEEDENGVYQLVTPF